MKSPRLLLGGLVAAGLVLNFAAPVARASDTVLLNFTDNRVDPDDHTEIHAYAWSWNDWKKPNVRGYSNKGQRGVLITAPSGKGNLGESGTAVKFWKTPTVYLHYTIGNNNAAKALSFGLTDADGTEAFWKIELEGKTKGAEVIQKMDLTKPDDIRKPGKTPGLDLKKVVDWQIQGDYQDDRVEVLLIRLVGEK